MLLGHIDTVIPHDDHHPLRRDGERLRGAGAYDMKGGLVICAGVMRALAQRRELFGQLDLLCVTDEEWRRRPLRHDGNGYDACLCFEGGEKIDDVDAVIVRRKGALLLRVDAHGQAAHAGAATAEGRSALLALATIAEQLSARAAGGADELTVAPTILHAGEAINRIPDRGMLGCDVRSYDMRAAERIRDAVPATVNGVELHCELSERFPAMDCRAATVRTIADAAQRIDRPLLAADRGGSSDAAFIARDVPRSIDGLGPIGGADHSIDEYVIGNSFEPRAQIALAATLAALA